MHNAAVTLRSSSRASRVDPLNSTNSRSTPAIGSPQFRDQPWQHGVRQHEHVADRHPPATTGCDRSVRLRGLRPQAPALRRARDSSAWPASVNSMPRVPRWNSGVADFALELSDLDRQRRLRHPQPFGGLADAARLGHGDEIAKPVKIHRHTENVWVDHQIGIGRRVNRSVICVNAVSMLGPTGAASER